MNKLFFAICCLGLAGSFAYAEEEKKVGFLIPSQCQPKGEGAPKPEGSRDAWPAPHTTDCALEPACIKSG